ncbi:LmeA family phospholipid-binding protein [Salininema proteolyticum]|uniref:DUF2993 domain-containing protein n=1 Tax=Salininema proteolyticum TaxID=1607685 RepID=A0ABV8TWI6_9ACTN
MSTIVRRILIGLLILGIVLVLGDRVAANLAQDEIADSVAQRAEESGAWSSDRVDVQIHGFPFLTQVVDGDMERIDIDLSSVSYSSLTFDSFDITAEGVEGDPAELMKGTGEITARDLRGTAVIGLDDLSALVPGDHEVEFHREDGGLAADITTDVFGTELTLSTDVAIAVSDGAIDFQAGELDTKEGTMPDGAETLIAGLASFLDVRVPIPELPYGLRLEDVSVGSDGLRLTAVGEDTVLRSAAEPA